MPQVPVVQGPRVSPTGLPDVRQAVPQIGGVPDVQLSTPQISVNGLQTPQLHAGEFDTPQLHLPGLKSYTEDPSALRTVQLSDRGASQMIAEGQNLSSAGNQLADVAIRMQQKVNATVVDDALNQARNTAMKLTWGSRDPQSGNVTGGYRNLKGEDAFRRPSGMGLDDEVGNQYDDAIKAIAKGKLSNPDQLAAFQAQANDIGTQLRAGAMSHQSEQFDAYHDDVYKSMVDNLAAEFGTLDPSDRASQQRALTQIDQAVATRMSVMGASAQQMVLTQRTARTQAVKNLFETARSNKDYLTAQAIINEYGGKGGDGLPVIDPETTAQMKLTLDGHVAIQLGEQIGQKVWQQSAVAPAFNPQDTDRAFNIAVKQETGGQHVDAKGKLVVSEEGAGGIAQLTRDTAQSVVDQHHLNPTLVDLAFTPTKEGSAANLMIGRMRFQDMVTQFKGDIPKALAAYNAGPAWLVGGKDKNGQPIPGALKEATQKGGQWQDYLPKETQAYVKTAMASFGAGHGAPARPSLNQLRDQADAMSDDPDVRRASYTYLSQRYEAAKQDETSGYENAYASGIRQVLQANGNLNAVDPAVVRDMKPEDYSKLFEFSKSLASGQYVTTDPAAYYRATNRDFLKSATPAQLEGLRTGLSPEDYGHVRQMWEDVHNPAPDKGPNSLDTSTLDSLVKTRLEYLGVNTAPKKGDPGEARLGAITQFVHHYVLDYQRTTGEKITDYGAMEKVVNQMFTKSQDFRTTVFGVTTGHGAQNVLTSKVDDIPSDIRDRLHTQLKGALKREPSETDMLQAYFRSQFYR